MKYDGIGNMGYIGNKYMALNRILKYYNAYDYIMTLVYALGIIIVGRNGNFNNLPYCNGQLSTL